MNDIILLYDTSLTRAFFNDSDSNDRFDDWFKDRLSEVGLFNWQLTDTPQGISGISSLAFYVNDFDDEHHLEVRAVVDGGNLDFDEIADNATLFDYIESQLADRIAEELNTLCGTIFIPMTDGTFKDMLFTIDNDFYGLIHSYKGSLFASPYLKEESFYVLGTPETYI